MRKGQTLVRYETTSLNINIPVRLKNKIWKYSYEIGLPMTQTVILLLNQALESKDVISQLPVLTDFINDYKLGKYKDKSTNELV